MRIMLSPGKAGKVESCRSTRLGVMLVIKLVAALYLETRLLGRSIELDVLDQSEAHFLCFRIILHLLLLILTA